MKPTSPKKNRGFLSKLRSIQTKRETDYLGFRNGSGYLIAIFLEMWVDVKDIVKLNIESDGICFKQTTVLAKKDMSQTKY